MSNISEITIYDVECVYRIECCAPGCDNVIEGETDKKVLKQARDEGWVERDFERVYRGIVCDRCNHYYNEHE